MKNERERTVSRSSYRAKPKARFVLCFFYYRDGAEAL